MSTPLILPVTNTVDSETQHKYITVPITPGDHASKKRPRGKEKCHGPSDRLRHLVSLDAVGIHAVALKRYCLGTRYLCVVSETLATLLVHARGGGPYSQELLVCDFDVRLSLDPAQNPDPLSAIESVTEWTATQGVFPVLYIYIYKLSEGPVDRSTL